MDEASENQSDSNLNEPDIVFGKTERVTERINGDIKIKTYENGSRKIIEVGNTGLSVILDTKEDSAVEAHSHFMPEGWSSHHRENQAKYTSIFGFSIIKLMDWIKNPDNARQLGIGDTSNLAFKTLSQPELSKMMKKMFEKYGHSEIIQGVGKKDDKEWITLDWKGLLGLDENDSLIKFLRKLEQRATSLKVTYDKQLDEWE